MRHLTTALAAMMTIALGAAPAEAQRATISPTSASGTEAENLEFEIDGVWRYNAVIQFRVISGTATEGPDFRGDSGTYCHTGESAAETCAGGYQPTPRGAFVLHWPDDEIEGDETYTVEAWVARYETGETDANGEPVMRECPTGCGRARATGTIIDLNEPEPLSPGIVGLAPETASVAEGGAISLTVTFTPPDDDGASDLDGTVESYKWNGLGGFNSRSGDSIRWTAPEPHVETTYTLSVTVTDNEGATASDSINITVEGPEPEPANAPTVTLTADSYEVDGGGNVTLTATAAVTGSRIVSYQWSGEGDFSGSGSQVTWRAPGPPVATDYVLSVTVTDKDGATASDSVSIRVGANSAPTLSVEADVYTVHPDEVVTLTATAADDGRIVSYRWSGGYAGFADVDTGNTTWTAPDTVDPTNYVLSLTVTDDDGATASDSVSIRVARNRRPSVKLTAADYAIDTGETVTLTADARDSDGTIVSYVWSDRASRGEFSEPATGATVDWTAPSPTESTTYTLEVKVTDDDGGFKVDQVEVRVSPPEPAPPPPPAPPKLTGWVTTNQEEDGQQTYRVVVLTEGFGTLESGSFQWSGEGLFSETTVSDSGSGTVIWTPPRVTNSYYQGVWVRVTDSEGRTARERSPLMLIKKSDTPNKRPSVRVSASATEIDGGDEISLDVTASDRDGTIESYTWSASPNRGSFGTMASDGDITWTAPVRHSRREYELKVSVKDDAGGITEKSTTIRVTATPNQPPLLDRLSVSGATSTDTGFETGLGHNVGLHTYHYDANGSLKPGASDPDGTIESYEWSAVPEGGSFRNAGTPGVARWIAPTEVGQYVVTATAIDDDGGTASASETFRVVVRQTNAAPTVALEAHATTVAGGAVVRLTASANDRDGTIESYTWSGEGTFTARGAEGKSPRVDWTAPSADGDYQLTVRVTDNAGGTATDSVVITVTGTDNIAPTVRLSASSRRIEAGGETSLTASAEDTDGTIASYAWSEENDAGTFTARGPMDQSARVDRTAPSPDADSEYTLSVTVTDNEGGTASATVEVTVGNAGNEPPTVSLTAAETEVEAGEKIRLTASATDVRPANSSSRPRRRGDAPPQRGRARPGHCVPRTRGDAPVCPVHGDNGRMQYPRTRGDIPDAILRCTVRGQLPRGSGDKRHRSGNPHPGENNRLSLEGGTHTDREPRTEPRGAPGGPVQRGSQRVAVENLARR